MLCLCLSPVIILLTSYLREAFYLLDLIFLLGNNHFIEEGNGNPLQCSCLENPRDGGALVSCHLWGRTESDTTEAT